MDVTSQIEKFQDFIESNYQKRLHDLIKLGTNSINMDFNKLLEFDPELTEDLLEDPEEVLKAFELALSNLDIGEKFRIRIIGLPSSQEIKIRDIRSEHLNKLMTFEGIVRQSSDVRPQVISAKFECPSCGNTSSLLQVDTKFKEPSRCSCGRRGKFRMIDKALVDVQRLLIEESPESLEGGEQPKRLAVFLKEDLVEPRMEKKTTPGSRVKIVGIIKEIPVTLRTGAQSTRYDIVAEVNSIVPLEEVFSDVEINEEDEAEIKELARDSKIFDRLIKSIAPSIYGHEEIKKALVLQLMGGVRKIKEDKTVTRGDMHILLVGDPGSGKSALISFISKAAPKARYIAGRSASGAGITASVVRDEFLRGWALEAGAIVLANNGLLALDEMDKMTVEDSSALHEALEQQSYHPDTEVTLGDGSINKIGVLVDNLMEKNKEFIIKGKDCEILPFNLELLTTDFKKIYKTISNRISRHIAPDYFIEIEYSNGRKIIVTPEHPVFVFDSKIRTIPAKKIIQGSLSPTPRILPIEGKNELLEQISLTRMNKNINFPNYVDENFASLMGYFISEGHAYYQSSNSYAEIGISNTDHRINQEVNYLMNDIFKTHINKNIIPFRRKKRATLDLTTTRCCSVPLYNFFKTNFMELIRKSTKKRVSNSLRILDNKLKTNMLATLFKGDGFIDSERFGYSTSSYGLAKDYQDILLNLGIYSYIAIEKRDKKQYYKVVISGEQNMNKFIKDIVDPSDHRLKRLIDLLQRSRRKNNDRDILSSELSKRIKYLLKELRLDDGYFYNTLNKEHNFHQKTAKKYLEKIKKRIKRCNEALIQRDILFIRKKLNIQVKELSSKHKVSVGTIYNLKKRKDNGLADLIIKLGRKKLIRIDKELEKLEDVINSDIRFVKIKSVRKIKNDNIKWVYDVTVEPTHNFISEGLVLHNTVTISKANIQATLRAQTTVLAAANPKFGRFDPYSPIAQQIDLPAALINRFDLIFPIRDLPDKERDAKIAQHVLDIQQKDIIKTDISSDLLKKYIAYAKQNVFPKLTKGSVDEIKNYYVTLRNIETVGDEGIKPIPISARQLEALVRLAEGSARVRLSNKVTRQDAKIAISLLNYCLNQIGIDPETGKIDIDRISTGITASQRSKIFVIREIINELKKRTGKLIPIDEIISEASGKKIEESEVIDIIERLKREGEIYEPKRNHIEKMD